MRLLATILCILFCGCQDYNVLGASDGSLPEDDGTSGSDPGSDPGGDQAPEVCYQYPGALANCNYQYVLDPQDDCLRADCMPDACRTDADCPMLDAEGAGDRCVLGNCVYCAEDPDCFGPEICRAGRCLERDFSCRENPVCDDFQHCDVIRVSAGYCPVCNCDSLYQHDCGGHQACISTIGRLEYCVYGRCAECVNDDDCEWGQCLPPGMCFEMWPHPAVLFGTWMIGWPGGMNHYSYFRFEPDGTLRRGSYQSQEPWSDDIPNFPCYPDDPAPMPYLGTWEPLATESGLLAVRMTLNTPCDDRQGWSARYAVELAGEGDIGMFLDLDDGPHYDVQRMPFDTCTPDFASCQAP